MCVMSMVMDHYGDKWDRLLPWQVPPAIDLSRWIPPISQAEVDEFRELLRKAREYDKQHNEPNCELESKKDRIRKLAEELGVKIDFL